MHKLFVNTPEASQLALRSCYVEHQHGHANPAETSSHAPARRHCDERRRHHHAGVGGRRCSHDFRLQRRRDPADLRRRVPLQQGAHARRRGADAVDRARERAGCGFHGRGLRARERPGRRGHGHVRTGRDELRDARARLHGGLDSDRRHLRSSFHRLDRHRRVPRSTRDGRHGLCRKARVSRDGPVPLGSHRAHGVRDRAHRPTRTGRRRRAEGRAELARRVPRRRLTCRSRDTGNGSPASKRIRCRMRAARSSSRCSRRASAR